jgi:hypothetical protein
MGVGEGVGFGFGGVAGDGRVAGFEEPGLLVVAEFWSLANLFKRIRNK